MKRVRFDLILEFDDDITQEEYEKAMENIYNELHSNCSNIDVIAEDEF